MAGLPVGRQVVKPPARPRESRIIVADSIAEWPSRDENEIVWGHYSSARSRASTFPPSLKMRNSFFPFDLSLRDL